MAPGDLTGKHALVCGASQGIGRATALKLADRGCEVTVLARTREALVSLVHDLTVKGVKAHVLVADLEDRPALKDQVAAHIEAHGPIHILINNTGGPPAGPLLEATEEDLMVPYGRHLLASHLLVQTLLPGMKESSYGRIINVLSTSVREPIPNLGVSNTIRAAMASWAKTLSRELPPGVTINSVLPGYTDTERLDALAGSISQRTGKDPDAVRAGWIGVTPEGRLGRPEELAAAIAFLASPDAGYIRGVVLPVDGGRLQSI
jgi:3-oxoacyl-[acyl-carrier protein] reductase